MNGESKIYVVSGVERPYMNPTCPFNHVGQEFDISEK